tara:strand:- start:1320 stop:1730 length:411 start_codon:yes stop_codon:yes gene_type:complete
MIPSPAARVNLSSAPAASVTTNDVKFDLGSLTTVGLSAIPNAFLLDHLEAQLVVTAGAPMRATAYLSYDSAGDDICQPSVEVDITFGQTASKGAAMWGIDSAVCKPVQYNNDVKLYLWIKLNSGTATVTPRLHWGV